MRGRNCETSLPNPLAVQKGHTVHLGFHFFGQALHKGVHLSSRIFPQQGVLQDPVILKYFGLAYFAFLLNKGNKMPV